MGTRISTLQKAIEIVESLPSDEQEILVEVIRRRMLQRRRAVLIGEVAEARKAYGRGEVRRGSVDDLLGELEH